jgi:hypothetical protein
MITQMDNNDPQKRKMKKDQNPPPVTLSNRCVETSAQINHVLSVMAMTSASLANYKRQGYSEETKEHPLKLSEGELALEKTLWAACSRMEKILDDDARWDDTFQRKVEKEYDELHKLQMDAIEQQKRAAAEVVSPHFRYRPDLKRLRNGQWMAILGNDDQLEFAIYGIGDSAQQAMEEFDMVFNKGVPASVFQFALKREAALNNGTEHPTFPNQEQVNEKSNDKE